jgi:hypothetical protein
LNHPYSREKCLVACYQALVIGWKVCGMCERTGKAREGTMRVGTVGDNTPKRCSADGETPVPHTRAKSSSSSEDTSMLDSEARGRGIMTSPDSYLGTALASQFGVQSKLAYALLAALAVCAANYAITSAAYNRAVRNNGPQRIPPVVPHFVPFLGSVPWQYALSPIEFFTTGYASPFLQTSRYPHTYLIQLLRSVEPSRSHQALLQRALHHTRP